MNKVVVITGSSRGLGFGLAKRFLEAGCRVMVNESSKESAGRAMEGLRAFGDKTSGFAADVSASEGVEALFESAVRTFGRVDLWINNAGITQRQVPARELDPEEINRVLSLDIRGVVHGTIISFRKMCTVRAVASS